MLKPTLIALSMIASPAFASSHYQAVPASKPEATRLILRDTIWRCGEAGCQAAKSGSRPAVVCALLVKKLGALRSFSVAGAPLDAEQLEKCNARAD